jgi:hypothetical protein
MSPATERRCLLAEKAIVPALSDQIKPYPWVVLRGIAQLIKLNP